MSLVACSGTNLPPGAETEAALGTARWLEERYGLNESLQVYEEMSRVTARLAATGVGRALERESVDVIAPGVSNRSWEVVVIRAREPNAFSLGSGLIVVTEGLLLQLRSEAELAAVLSHEMAHQLLGHTRAALAAQPLTNVSRNSGPTGSETSDEALLDSDLQEPPRNPVNPAVSYSLEDEIAADTLGVKILYVARYDISHALGALTLGNRQFAGIVSGIPPEWMAQRSAHIAQHIQEIGEYLPATDTTREFSRMQRLVAGL